jgi:hypothetical protein
MNSDLKQRFERFELVTKNVSSGTHRINQDRNPAAEVNITLHAQALTLIVAHGLSAGNVQPLSWIDPFCSSGMRKKLCERARDSHSLNC